MQPIKPIFLINRYLNCNESIRNCTDLLRPRKLIDMYGIFTQTLGVDVLDYSAKGNGKTSLLVKKGGERPDVKFYVELEQGEVHRRDESQAFKVTMSPD